MSARDKLTPEQRATLAEQLGDALPARNSLLMSFGKSVQDRRDHDHTTQREDWYCLNLAAYMGERAAPVLRRLLDAETEIDGLRARVAELEAELRIGPPWKCPVCSKENRRDVCMICETYRPEPDNEAEQEKDTSGGCQPSEGESTPEPRVEDGALARATNPDGARQ
ncbi:hypothetical protein ACFSL4_01655 [Streptomyces caeni]|uniref:RanBP2-type domain-containing protein n=1 Tax=Streptomyces caeni TaxID=2307231 RepID=A0ABW4IJ71_9ACTN